MNELFARDGAPMRATAADFHVTLYDCHALSRLGCVYRGAFAAGSAADHQYVIMFPFHLSFPGCQLSEI